MPRATPASKKAKVTTSEQFSRAYQPLTFDVQRKVISTVTEKKLTARGYDAAYGQIARTTKDWREVICPPHRVIRVKERLYKQQGALMMGLGFDFLRRDDIPAEANPGDCTFGVFYHNFRCQFVAYDDDEITTEKYMESVDEPERPLLQTAVDFIKKFPAVILPANPDKEGNDRMPIELVYVPDNTEENWVDYFAILQVTAADQITPKELENLYFVLADHYYENLHRGNEEQLELFPAVEELMLNGLDKVK